MACHLHKKFNFRPNLTRIAIKSCGAKDSINTATDESDFLFAKGSLIVFEVGEIGPPESELLLLPHVQIWQTEYPGPVAQPCHWRACSAVPDLVDAAGICSVVFL
jgi:hypothetical protein